MQSTYTEGSLVQKKSQPHIPEVYIFTLKFLTVTSYGDSIIIFSFGEVLEGGISRDAIG